MHRAITLCFLLTVPLSALGQVRSPAPMFLDFAGQKVEELQSFFADLFGGAAGPAASWCFR